MTSIERYTSLLEETLKAQTFGIQPADLYDPMHYILQLGGKRLRPAMVLAGCELFEGAAEDALQAAMGIELFHNFSLIHDDIMDKAPLRRGKKTVHHKWNENVGILSGDAMLVKAYQYVAQVSPQALPAVLECFSQTAMEVCEGQQYDMDFETTEAVSEAAYIEMIRLKTSVLLGAALKIGAIIAGASVEAQTQIYNFGVNIGIAFQIQDDLLDSFGDPAKFGKKVGGDIANNKQTLLMISARNKANKAQLASLSEAETLSEQAKIDTVKSLFEATGARAYTEHTKDYYFQQSLDYLNAVESTHPLKEELTQFAAYLVQRDR
jgi:geranylgeranyl diphosphate synthase type II